MQEIWKAADVAVETQEWYQKAVSNVDGETEVVEVMDDKSRVVGTMYENTIVQVEEKGEAWTKISSGKVNGYVKNETLAFGSDAVERARKVCPEIASSGETGKSGVIARETKPAKTVEELAAERAAAEQKRAEEERRQRAEAEAEGWQTAETAEGESAEAAGMPVPEAAQQADGAWQADTGSFGNPVTEMSAGGYEQSLLAALIFCEAGGEPYEGQVAVGAVVLNRVRSGIFPNSISEVIYQSGQFGPAMTGKLDSVLADGRTTESCYQAAADALAGANPVGAALYFGNGDYGQLIGNHWFH